MTCAGKHRTTGSVWRTYPSDVDAQLVDVAELGVAVFARERLEPRRLVLLVLLHVRPDVRTVRKRVAANLKKRRTERDDGPRTQWQ